ncbi:hypothetical protein C0Q70_12866 [Pomacea canaliculata]|uniref:PiggyBac transposable element-derived protein domain-containing protein n=1 Tax=Pomacea canaliculata TaxID=400727 RepID=A0A2T7P2N8_POMCA|nr:hypothetical protein C0Q70_12866 [Pomacea canaliculata]
MARECKYREMCELFLSDSDEEMELEVGDDDYKDECLYVEENSSSEEDEEELNYGNRSADQYMTEQCRKGNLVMTLFTKLRAFHKPFEPCAAKNTVVLRWKDKTDVAVLSTIHRPQMVAVNTRTSCKEEAHSYCGLPQEHGRGGPQRSYDFYNAFYRKTTKMVEETAFHMLTLTMVQAHCLYLKLILTLRARVVTR